MTETQLQQTGRFGVASEPLVTGDGIAAFSLRMAGTPFADDGFWCVNYYTPEILRKLGYGGVSMREGAKRALRDGKPGVIRFMLCQPSSEIAAAYGQQIRELDERDDPAMDALRNLLDDYKSGVRSYAETAVRVCCLILKMRIQWMNAWKNVVPLLRIDDNKLPMTSGANGNTVVEYGGVKFVSVDASEETLRHMGL
jgi:hypothetical protein